MERELKVSGQAKVCQSFYKTNVFILIFWTLKYAAELGRAVGLLMGLSQIFLLDWFCEISWEQSLLSGGLLHSHEPALLLKHGVKSRDSHQRTRHKPALPDHHTRWLELVLRPRKRVHPYPRLDIYKWLSLCRGHLAASCQWRRLKTGISRSAAGSQTGSLWESVHLPVGISYISGRELPLSLDEPFMSECLSPPTGS